MRRLARVNIAKAVRDLARQPANSDRAAAGICAVVPRALMMVDDEDVARFLTRTLLGELEKVNLAPVAGEVLELVTTGEHYHALFDDALKGVERLITANQALILEKFGEASKYTPGFIDQYIVDRFVAGIVLLLKEVTVDPRHPLRKQFADAMRALIEKLKTSPEMHERGTAIKRQIIEHLRTKPYYIAIWNDIKHRILDDVSSDRSRLREAWRRCSTLGLWARKGRRDAAQAQRVAARSAADADARSSAPDLAAHHRCGQELERARCIRKGRARNRQGSAVHPP